MPIPSSLADLSVTPALNSPPGAEPPGVLDDYIRTHAAFIKQVDNKAVAAGADAAVTAEKLDTTAVIRVLKAAYPIGSVYTNASVATNPATLLGFGTWTAFGAGRVPVGFDAADPLFDTAEETGGSKDAVVVSHTHTATVTDPGHVHSILYQTTVSGPAYGSTGTGNSGGTATDSAVTGITVSNSTTGSPGTNANLQPYITVYMWKRTA